MTIDLTNQQAVITGAANGIGAAIAKAFLDAGSSVLALDSDADALAAFRKGQSGNLETATADVSDFDSLKEIAAGRNVDHLICAAAIGSGVGGFPFWNQSPADWGRVIDVTLMGTVNTLHAFVPPLLSGETDRKSVAILASVAGQIGSQTDPPYSACKAAIINFAQCAAKDFASRGIRVNAISPGMVRTALSRSVFEANKDSEAGSYEEWGIEKVEKTAPLARWQEPEEFGAMAVYLASEHGRNITGQTINIDGGQVMHS
ncbi:MAG: SDR family oxidoreductase [Verrucomicrobiales bacterium]|nr:SDR family oxidoreductase [Verrucomicrobiales bacterium]